MGELRFAIRVPLVVFGHSVHLFFAFERRFHAEGFRIAHVVFCHGLQLRNSGHLVLNHFVVPLLWHRTQHEVSDLDAGSCAMLRPCAAEGLAFGALIGQWFPSTRVNAVVAGQQTATHPPVGAVGIRIADGQEVGTNRGSFGFFRVALTRAWTPQSKPPRYTREVHPGGSWSQPFFLSAYRFSAFATSTPSISQMLLCVALSVFPWIVRR